MHDRQASSAEKSDLTGNYRHGDRASTITRIRILTAEGQETTAVQAGEDIIIEVEAKFNRPVSQPMIGMLIRNRLGIEVFGTNTKIEGIELGDFAKDDSSSFASGFVVFSPDRNIRSLWQASTRPAPVRTGWMTPCSSR